MVMSVAAASLDHETRHERSDTMSRHIQVTFDARDPRALSSFWRDLLGYVHPAPPGVDLREGADPLAAWDDFLARVGVPEEQRNTKSAIEDPPTDSAHDCSFSRCPRTRSSRTASTSTCERLQDYRARSGWPRLRPNANASSPWERRGYVATSLNPRWGPASS